MIFLRKLAHQREGDGFVALLLPGVFDFHTSLYHNFFYRSYSSQIPLRDVHLVRAPTRLRMTAAASLSYIPLLALS